MIVKCWSGSANRDWSFAAHSLESFVTFMETFISTGSDYEAAWFFENVRLWIMTCSLFQLCNATTRKVWLPRTLMPSSRIRLTYSCQFSHTKFYSLLTNQEYTLDLRFFVWPADADDDKHELDSIVYDVPKTWVPIIILRNFLPASVERDAQKVQIEVLYKETHRKIQPLNKCMKSGFLVSLNELLDVSFNRNLALLWHFWGWGYVCSQTCNNVFVHSMYGIKSKCREMKGKASPVAQ